jgi:hypothetical protein
VRRLVLPLTLAFVASLFLAPAAVAQYYDPALQAQDTPQEDVTEELVEELVETPEQVEPVEEELQEAQQEAALEQQAGVPEPAEVEDQKQIPQGGQQKQMPKQQKQMPKTGGVELNALLLPAAVLLVGTGLLAAYGIRRYRR